MSDILKQLKALKNEPVAGAVSGSRQLVAREKLMEAIGHTPTETPQIGFSYAHYYRWSVLEFISTPMTVGATVVVLLFGGWLTTVNAAQSLPGDTLYTVKIATERAQLRMASLEHKAVLHTEFAGRRLEEAAAIKDSVDPEQKEYYKSTMEAFKQQVTLAEGDLRKMQQEGNEQTSTVASQIDNQIDKLTTALSTTNGTVAGPELNDAIDVTREISHSVVNVIVEEHEATLIGGSSTDVQTAFKKDLTNVYTRQALALARVQVIKNVLAEHPEAKMTAADALERSLKQATEHVGDAQNIVAAGGYREGFTILREAEEQLLTVERQIVDMEIIITTTFSSQEDVSGEIMEETQVSSSE